MAVKSVVDYSLGASTARYIISPVTRRIFAYIHVKSRMFLSRPERKPGASSSLAVVVHFTLVFIAWQVKEDQACQISAAALLGSTY